MHYTAFSKQLLVLLAVHWQQCKGQTEDETTIDLDIATAAPVQPDEDPEQRPRRPLDLQEYALWTATGEVIDFGQPVEIRPFVYTEGDCSAETWAVVQKWESLATAISDALMSDTNSSVPAPTQEFVTAFYRQLELLRTDQTKPLDSLKHMLEYSECDRLKKFAIALFIPAIMMPFSGISLMFIRVHLGWCGASYQPYNVLLYRIVWIGLCAGLFLIVIILISCTALAFIATSGFVHGLKQFDKTAEQFFGDIEVAAWNVKQALLHLSGVALDRTVSTIFGNFDWMDVLISDSVWRGLPDFVQSGIETLGSLINESDAIRDGLFDLDEKLHQINVNTEKADIFLRKQQQNLWNLKETCTTPYFCERIDPAGLEVALETVVLDVSREANATEAIILSGFPALIRQACERFNKTGHILAAKTNHILQESTESIKTWSGQVFRLLDPLLNVSKPTLEEVTRSRDKFRQLPSKIGGVSIFLVRGGVLVGRGEYLRNLLLRTDRTTFNAFFVFRLCWIGINGRDVLLSFSVELNPSHWCRRGSRCQYCPRCNVSPLGEWAVSLPRNRSGLLEDNNPVSDVPQPFNISIASNDSTPASTGISIGRILEDCAKNYSFLEILSFLSQTGSEVQDVDHSLEFRIVQLFSVADDSEIVSVMNQMLPYISWTETPAEDITVRTTAETTASTTDDVVLEFTAPESITVEPEPVTTIPTFKYFPDELVSLLAAYQSNLTHFNLQDQRTQLGLSITKVPIYDYMKELSKVRHGLISKPGEQEAIDRILTALDREYQTRLFPAHSTQVQLMQEIDDVERKMTVYERTPKRFSESKQAIENYAKQNMYRNTLNHTMHFINRIPGYLEHYSTFVGEKVMANRTRECGPIQKAMGQFTRLLCHCIIGNMLLLGFTLVAAGLTFAPACILATLLSRQLTILPESDHADDYFERGIPADFRKWPRRKTFI
ncbi:uncharacterized protein LOC129590218 isoform X2 [Paramacrobiotus metropolitanus]|uniref:uncharacterized protein LOC129590218 isoform X2 n=1 Tax=Paramacrobiotus metropolitanus TaxID=2943436 RepID=UPI002446521A|nr:uncharacterized protein LOC129590218 isoform X2 [Paramacrobiotus metropolitanus]